MQTAADSCFKVPGPSCNERSCRNHVALFTKKQPLLEFLVPGLMKAAAEPGGVFYNLLPLLDSWSQVRCNELQKPFRAFQNWRPLANKGLFVMRRTLSYSGMHVGQPAVFFTNALMIIDFKVKPRWDMLGLLSVQA